MGAAAAVIEEALQVAQRPYVAFSGGKDSLVVLALVAMQRPGIETIWADDELEHDEQPVMIPVMADALGARLTIVTGGTVHAGWFRPWTNRPFWRDPVLGMVTIGPAHAPRRTDQWSVDQGYDLAFLGLRAAEAPHRVVNARRRGRLYVTCGQWRCQPLAWWGVDDVWAAIGALGLTYSPVYDDLARAGVPREAQRVGPLPLAPGWVLRATWPALHRRLVTRYGDRWGG